MHIQTLFEQMEHINENIHTYIHTYSAAMQSDEASVDEADEEDSILGSPTSQHTDNNLKLGHSYMHTYIHT